MPIQVFTSEKEMLKEILPFQTPKVEISTVETSQSIIPQKLTQNLIPRLHILPNTSPQTIASHNTIHPVNFSTPQNIFPKIVKTQNLTPLIIKSQSSMPRIESAHSLLPQNVELQKTSQNDKYQNLIPRIESVQSITIQNTSQADRSKPHQPISGLTQSNVTKHDSDSKKMTTRSSSTTPRLLAPKLTQCSVKASNILNTEIQIPSRKTLVPDIKQETQEQVINQQYITDNEYRPYKRLKLIGQRSHIVLRERRQLVSSKSNQSFSGTSTTNYDGSKNDESIMKLKLEISSCESNDSNTSESSSKIKRKIQKPNYWSHKEILYLGKF